MNPVLPPPHSVGRKPARSAIVLSAFVAPGAGQVAQRRWLVALAYGLGFLACFVAFVAYTFRIIWVYYSLPTAEPSRSQLHLPVGKAALFFSAALVL